MVEVDDRPVLLHLLRDLVVGRGAPRRVERGARLVDERLHVVLAVAGVVGRPLAGEHRVQVAVRVRAPAPREHVGLELALVGEVERGGELGRLDLHVKARVLGHRLHYLADFLRVGGGGGHEREARVRHARLLQELLRALEVPLGHARALAVVLVGRRHPLVARLRLAFHDHLDDGVAVERELERLAHARVLAERVLLRHVALADVDGDALVADLDDLGHLEAAVVLDAGDVGGGNALDEVELPGAQVREAHGRVDDGLVDDAVEVDLALVPVVRVAIEHDAVLRDALDELERAGAHRVGGELLACRLGRLGRHHHPRAVGEHREQRRERRREVDAHGRGVDHVDARHHRELAAAVRALHVLVALEVVLDRGGVELLAVVEGDAAAELELERLVIGRPLMGRGELGNDVQLLVEVEELVAQAGEDDAPDEGARARRVEDVGVLGEADAQGLSVDGSDGEEKGKCEQFHDGQPPEGWNAA